MALNAAGQGEQSNLEEFLDRERLTVETFNAARRLQQAYAKQKITGVELWRPTDADLLRYQKAVETLSSRGIKVTLPKQHIIITHIPFSFKNGKIFISSALWMNTPYTK
jgi:hypothetical protein